MAISEQGICVLLMGWIYLYFVKGGGPNSMYKVITNVVHDYKERIDVSNTIKNNIVLKLRNDF